MIKKVSLERLYLMAFAQVMKNVRSFLAKQADLAELGLIEVKTEYDTAFLELESPCTDGKMNKQRVL